MTVHVVDLLQDSSGLVVQWRANPGAGPSAVSVEMQARIREKTLNLRESERRAGVYRDVAAHGWNRGLGPTLEESQLAIGQTLYYLLDGAERALTCRMEEAGKSGASILLVIRLRAERRTPLARHVGVGWPFQLLAAPGGEPLSLGENPAVAIIVQLGDVDIAEPELHAGGRLQMLFMAYSPRGVAPELDYEGEEDRILEKLAPFVERRRLVIRVAEEGSLEELGRRLMDRAYDVVHLTGHGVVTEHGTRLVMEDADGERDDVSGERLVQVFRRSLRMPRMVVISSCHSTEKRGDLPSLAAELIEGGVPCVVGWSRPVLDVVATDAAEEVYRRLCSGEAPADAVAGARRELRRGERGRTNPEHAWATLQILTSKASGFAIDPKERPAQEAAYPGVTHRQLGSRMRVLAQGFVGRRRELQTLGRVLRHSRWSADGRRERIVAGALVVGMKGQGKSCLVGRVIERHQQDVGEVSAVVLHGALDELQLLEAFRVEAVRLGDDAALEMLRDQTRRSFERVERVLRHHWREQRVVIVLDDFEQNLELQGEGPARVTAFAIQLLEVLLPICRDEQPKVLITSTARFMLPASLEGLLAEIALGALEGASVRKLWARGQSAELRGVEPRAWRELGERFGRNARMLDWARRLLGGKTPEELQQAMAEAGRALPTWRVQGIDEARQEALAEMFLHHMAFEEAARRVGSDAMAFVARARVYEVPVPMEAFAGLAEGLHLSLERHVVALANLGLLELGNDEGQAVYRVSPLVKAKFDAPEGPRWHAVAAAYWWKRATQAVRSRLSWIVQAWEHALAAKDEGLADQATPLLHGRLEERGLHRHSAALAARHLAVFPESRAGLLWAGLALHAQGDLPRARTLLERLVELWEQAHGAERSDELATSMYTLAVVLHSQADLAGAQERLVRSLEIHRRAHGMMETVEVAASLHELAMVLHSQGDFAGARARLDWSREILERVHGTQEHSAVAASLLALAEVMHSQGDLAGARGRMAQSLEILERVHGEQHPAVAYSLRSLAMVALAQDDLPCARAQIERSLEIQAQVIGTQEHPGVAASLHVLGQVLHGEGDLSGAQAQLECALEIQKRVYGMEEHPDVAVSLYDLGRVLHAQGRQAEARIRLQRALEIQQQVHGTPTHLGVAAILHELARVLRVLGDLAEAQAMLERSLAIQDQMRGGHDHFEVAAILHTLAEVLYDRGELAGAQFQLELALAMKQRLYGTQAHPSVIMSLRALGRVLREQGFGESDASLLHQDDDASSPGLPSHA